MEKLSADTKAIVASNLTLAFFVREHTKYSCPEADLNPDSEECVQDFFKTFLTSLEKKNLKT